MKMSSFVKIVVILLLIQTNTISQTNEKPLPKTVEYRLDLKIDYKLEKLFCHCDLTLLNASNQPLEQIPLLLYRLLTIKSVKNKNDKDIPFTQKVLSIAGWEKVQVNVITISLNSRINPGERRTIHLEYEGHILGYVETGWRYVKDHIDEEFTIMRTDGFGYPIVGYPTENDMMAIVKERYHYFLDVAVPDGLIVANGGQLIKKKKHDGVTTFSYKSIKPSWRIDIAIADFRVLEKIDSKVFYFLQDSVGARNIMQAMGRSLTLYTEWFGPLHDYRGYTIIEVPKGYGGQADVTSILLPADNFENTETYHGIYHELSHQWNVKPLDPRPCRFQSEGLAQFLQYLVSEKLNHEEHAISEAADRYMKRFQEACLKNPKYKTIPMKDYGIQDMTDYSYTNGMICFAIFYEIVGAEQFNKIIGSFYSEYRSRGATLEDFINHCKKNASMDLNRFYNDWIYTTKAIDFIIEGKTFEELIDLYTNE